MKMFADNIIHVTATVRGGRLAEVAIAPRHPPLIGRLLAGKQADDIVGLMPSLFALCSNAHEHAARTAIEAAWGVEALAAVRARRVVLVLIERMAELMRGLGGGTGVFVRPEQISVLRALRGTLTELTAALRLGATPAPDSLAALNDGLAALGVDPEEGPSEEIVAAISTLAGDVDRIILDSTAAPLRASHDRAVIGRLLEGGDLFAMTPALDGALFETGAFARGLSDRAVERDAPRHGGVADRLLARVREVPVLARRIAALLHDADADANGDDTIAGYAAGSRIGAAAVECARGRLFHLVELDNAGRVARFAYLAPTEWNFHPAGPLRRALGGAAVADVPRAREAITRLAGALDPCVEVAVDVRETGDA
jgi:hypothetical protein